MRRSELWSRELRILFFLFMVGCSGGADGTSSRNKEQAATAAPTVEPAADQESVAGRPHQHKPHGEPGVVGSVGPKEGSLPDNDRPAKDPHVAIAPLPNPEKLPVSQVVVPTTEQVSAQFAADAKGTPHEVSADAGVGPKLPKPGDAGLIDGFYLRVALELTPAGVVTAKSGRRIAGGSLRPTGTVEGSILIVARANDSYAYATTVLDPRPHFGHPPPDTNQGHSLNLVTGVANVSLPSQLADPQQIGTVSLEVWELSPSLPVTTPVNAENLGLLLAGAKQLDTVPAGTLSKLFNVVPPIP